MRLRLALTVLVMLIGAGVLIVSSIRPQTSSLNTSPDPAPQTRAAQNTSMLPSSAASQEPPDRSGSSDQESEPPPAVDESGGSSTGGTAVTAAPSGEVPADTDETTRVANPEALIAVELVEAANIEREKAGLAPLKVSDLLVEQALWWADYMPQGGYAHSDAQRLETIMDAGSYSAVGENLHAPEPQCPQLRNCPDSKDQPTARVVLIDWVNSPSHRDNLFDARWGYVGVGVHCADDGRMWVTALFSADSAREPDPARKVSAPRTNQGMTCLGVERDHNPLWQHP